MAAQARLLRERRRLHRTDRPDVPPGSLAEPGRSHRDLAGEGRAGGCDRRHDRRLGRVPDGEPRTVVRHVLYSAAKQAESVHGAAPAPRPTSTRCTTSTPADSGPLERSPGICRRSRRALRPTSASLPSRRSRSSEWKLPTRPPKKKDPEAKTWGDKPCVELDAIDPHQLTSLVEDAILEHVDPHAWNVEREVEAEERKGLLALAEGWGVSR